MRWHLDAVSRPVLGGVISRRRLGDWQTERLFDLTDDEGRTLLAQGGRFVIVRRGRRRVEFDRVVLVGGEGLPLAWWNVEREALPGVVLNLDLGPCHLVTGWHEPRIAIEEVMP